MKEIKFRAWDEKQKKVKYFDLSNNFNFNFWTMAKIKDLNSIEQFTGLHDKNGREIYDRDIVDGYDGLRFDVQWLEYDAEWNIGGYDAKRMDVIGNCFENPELIPTN